MVLEVFDVRVALQEPQQLIDNGLEVQFLGGEQRKTVRHVKPHLMAEHGNSARTCAVVLDGAFIEHALA